LLPYVTAFLATAVPARASSATTRSAPVAAPCSPPASGDPRRACSTQRVAGPLVAPTQTSSARWSGPTRPARLLGRSARSSAVPPICSVITRRLSPSLSVLPRPTVPRVGHALARMMRCQQCVTALAPSRATTNHGTGRPIRADEHQVRPFDDPCAIVPLVFSPSARFLIKSCLKESATNRAPCSVGQRRPRATTADRR
jgi:hypothetical protein